MGHPIRIAVTQLEYDKAKDCFEKAGATGLECIPAAGTEEQLASVLRESGARHAIVGVERYSGPLYAALPKGGVLARFGVGHDGVDKQAATKAGVFCTNTPGALDDSVAEYAIALILAAARHVPGLAQAVRGGEWKPRIGCELRGRTLALVGCGAIGRRVAQIAAFGFGMRIVACDPRSMDAAELRSACGVEHATRDFGEAVRDAHFVSLHLPSTPETRHFLNAARIGQMRRDAWLINTARGAVVDESALFDRLTSGGLAGAAVDVTEQEPYVPVDAVRDLRKLPNVIMTPHVSSSTQEACRRMAERALRNIELAEAGRFAEMDLLNRDVLGH